MTCDLGRRSVFFFQAEDGIRDLIVTGVQTCALPIWWGSYLAEVAEVEVSKAGELRVHRIVCAVDCGTVINPDTVKAQIEGGVNFGISGALWGEITLKNGRVEQSNFNNYRVLRMNEAPTIEVHLVRNLEAPGGIGEPGTSVTGPALANAVFAATGKRIRRLPLQPALRTG